MNAYTIPGIKTEEDIICDSFGIEKENFFSRSQARENVEARQFFLWIKHTQNKKRKGWDRVSRQYDDCRKKQGLPARNFSHANVMHACNTVNDLMQTDKIFREKAETAIRNLECIQK